MSSQVRECLELTRSENEKLREKLMNKAESDFGTDHMIDGSVAAVEEISDSSPERLVVAGGHTNDKADNVTPKAVSLLDELSAMKADGSEVRILLNVKVRNKSADLTQS